MWTEVDEDEDTTAACIMQLCKYLHSIYILLGHPPGRSWEQGSVSPIALSDLLDSGTEIFIWEHMDGEYRW